MPRHADVCCRIRHLEDNRSVEEYSLVGLLAEEIDCVLKALTDRFKAKTKSDRQLFYVADVDGYTDELDWDNLSLEGKYEFPLCPDLIGLPLARISDFEKCIKGNETRIGEYTLINKDRRISK